MRGKVSFGVVEDILDRITPAYAGKSIFEIVPVRFFPDHPRLCGEKLLHTFLISCYYRITPAYAGKRRLRLDRSTADGDHPRLCGEKMSLQKTAKRMQGSPPPMRGKEYNDRLFNACYRITPAYAGKRVELHAGK